MKVNDAISGALFIVLAGLIFIFTREFGKLPGQDYGAAFFPRTIAVIMALLGASLVVSGTAERDGKPWAQAFDWMHSPRHVANFILVIVSLIFYILVSDDLGFAITATITLFALLFWLRGASLWRSSLIISIVSMIGMQAFFGQFLRVPLPWGVLETYAW